LFGKNNTLHTAAYSTTGIDMLSTVCFLPHWVNHSKSRIYLLYSEVETFIYNWETGSLMYSQLHHQDGVQRLLLATSQTVLHFIYLYLSISSVFSCSLSTFLNKQICYAMLKMFKYK